MKVPVRLLYNLEQLALCIRNVPRSWSLLRFSFQIWRDDILLNISRRALNQPPKWPQFCLDYDSVTFVLPTALKSDVQCKKITYFGSRFWKIRKTADKHCVDWKQSALIWADENEFISIIEGCLGVFLHIAWVRISIVSTSE